MITIDEHGNLIPNIGEYKDPDAYLPAVILLETKQDKTTLSEFIRNGDIELQSGLREADYMTKALVCDPTDGLWIELEHFAVSAIHKGMTIIQEKHHQEWIRKQEEKRNEKRMSTGLSI